MMFSSLKSAVYNNHISIKTALAYFADALFRLHVYPCPEINLSVYGPIQKRVSPYKVGWTKGLKAAV